MNTTTSGHAGRVVATATFGFTVLFAVWVVFAIIGLPIRQEFGLTDTQLALLTALPVLTGSVLRLPAGLLADRLGGKKLFVGLTLLTALVSLALAYVPSYAGLLVAALCVGLAGVSFAIGNSWIAQWVPGERQGLALGTFGAGNVGASITKLLAPLLITLVPAGLLLPAGWRFVPFLYACLLLLTAVGIAVLAPNDRVTNTGRTLREWLGPLRHPQVWRFGSYYVLFFGAYVALSLWLPRQYVDQYGVSLATAGLLTALFIFPASLLRPLGGWLSDRTGPRAVTIASFVVIALGLTPLALLTLPLPAFVLSTLVVGLGMGVGKASNYKLVSHWYPRDMGVVGGLVGMLGGLGGFFLPLLFARLTQGSGPDGGPYLLLLGLAVGNAVMFYVSMLRIQIRVLRERLGGGAIGNTPV